MLASPIAYTQYFLSSSALRILDFKAAKKNRKMQIFIARIISAHQGSWSISTGLPPNAQEPLSSFRVTPHICGGTAASLPLLDFKDYLKCWQQKINWD